MGPPATAEQDHVLICRSGAAEEPLWSTAYSPAATGFLHSTNSSDLSLKLFQ